MKINATAFRNNLYNLLDQVIEQNESLEINRKGETIVIMKKQRKDIYAVFDSRTASVEEPVVNFDVKASSGLDENWEQEWENQWDEWLSEK